MEKCVRLASGLPCLLDTWMEDLAEESVCGECPRYSEKEPPYERFMYDYEPLQPDEFRV